MTSSVLAMAIAIFLFAYFFFFPNRIVHQLRDFTTFCLSSCRILVSPTYHGHIDSLSRTLDQLYKKIIRDQSAEIEKGLKDLKKADEELRKLAGKLAGLGSRFGLFGNHLTALAGHAETLSGYLGDVRDSTTDSGGGVGVIMVIGKHTPLVGLAFAALHPVLKVREKDAETKQIVAETIGNIGDLVKATTENMKDGFRLNAKELEEINMLLEMIEDGCDKLRIVVEDRKAGFWRRFGKSSRHQNSLKSWNNTVQHLLELQDRHQLNVVYYRTRLLLDRSKTHTVMLLFISATTLVVLKLLIDIKHHLEEPFYACVAKALIEIGSHLEPFRDTVLGFVSSIPPQVLKDASIQYFE